MKKLFLFFALVPFFSCAQQEKPLSVRMTESEMQRNPEGWQLDFKTKLKWDYATGVELQGFLNVYDTYGDKKIADYVTAFCDTMVNNDGTIKTYKLTEYSLDRINTGKLFFRIYERTGEQKYKLALDLLRSQFNDQPRTSEGGFWHKKIYPWQMWLDGLYMGAPFYAEYISKFETPKNYQDIIHQFDVVAKHTFDPATGLYRHAWDEKCEQQWADSLTGQSAHAWGRAMGWFAMAIVDALEFIPKEEPQRDSMLQILNSVAQAVKKYQDTESGVWYQVLDRSGDEGNYLESSCSSMFVFALYKAVRLGYLDKTYLEVAEKGYQGILKTFIETDENGLVSLTRTCAVAGLGGNPYRSGNYDYYINEKIRSNDPKAIGPFINASLEYERLHR